MWLEEEGDSEDRKGQRATCGGRWILKDVRYGAFVKASKVVYDQFSSEVATGAGLVKEILALAK